MGFVVKTKLRSFAFFFLLLYSLQLLLLKKKIPHSRFCLDVMSKIYHSNTEKWDATAGSWTSRDASGRAKGSRFSQANWKSLVLEETIKALQGEVTNPKGANTDKWAIVEKVVSSWYSASHFTDLCVHVCTVRYRTNFQAFGLLITWKRKVLHFKRPLQLLTTCDYERSPCLSYTIETWSPTRTVQL